VRTYSILAAAYACFAVEATAASYVVGGEVIIGPWLAPYGTVVVPSTIYDSFGPCLSPRNCSDYEQMRRFLDRYERNYGARFAPDKPVFAAPVQPRDVPPTPEADIQPGYQGASQIRPEFERVGKPVDRRSRIGK
jgi:hypothetical protein